MKNRSLNLSIDKPCGENWNTFAPAERGRFCDSCSKTVIDFTTASEEDIIRFMQQKPAHACGRFRASQLRTYPATTLSNVRPGFMLLKAGVLSLLLLTISKPGTAQSTQQKPATEIVDNPARSSESSTYLIKGIVRSTEDDSVLPGVSVVLKGSAIGTQTDEEGRFEFPQRLKPGDVLSFHFIGLSSQDITIRDQQQLVINLEMSMDFEMMGEIAVAEPYSSKESIFKRTWNKLKQIF